MRTPTGTRKRLTRIFWVKEILSLRFKRINEGISVTQIRLFKLNCEWIVPWNILFLACGSSPVPKSHHVNYLKQEIRKFSTSSRNENTLQLKHIQTSVSFDSERERRKSKTFWWKSAILSTFWLTGNKTWIKLGTFMSLYQHSRLSYSAIINQHQGNTSSGPRRYKAYLLGSDRPAFCEERTTTCVIDCKLVTCPYPYDVTLPEVYRTGNRWTQPGTHVQKDYFWTEK